MITTTLKFWNCMHFLLQGINCDSGVHNGDQIQDDHQPEEVDIAPFLT